MLIKCVIKDVGSWLCRQFQTFFLTRNYRGVHEEILNRPVRSLIHITPLEKRLIVWDPIHFTIHSSHILVAIICVIKWSLIVVINWLL